MRYEQIKPTLSEEVLDEVKMSPSSLMKFANSPEAEGMLMGVEWELCVPNVAVDDDSGEGEYDYDMDERAYSIDDIIEFFRNGEMSNLGSSSAQRLREKMWDEYLDWTNDKINDNLDEDDLNNRIRDYLSDDYFWEDYVDEAREELGDEVSDSDVEKRARELADAALDNVMSNADSSDYHNAYDSMRQEIEDEMREDADYDEEAWLRDIGVDYMSEAEREWNLDWPHWTTYNSEGDMDVESVGDEFGRAMGLEFVNTSNNYHGARRDGKNWIIEPDSSIDADQGDGGLEFVSPPMPIRDGLEMIQKMYKWAKDRGCYTNRSTGLHMNISVPDMTIDKLDYVKLALFLGDEYVLKKFGREYNSYCKSAISKIKDRVKPEDVSAVLAQMKQHLNSLASKTIHSGITDKYTSINTKSNYVEFRGPGGDYLDRDPFEIINTALRLSMSLRIATDPEAYKQEYAKKLFKLVEQEKDPDNSVKLFSQYAVGELPKEDLLARIKFARKERELEKTKKAGIERLINDPAIRDKIADFPMKWSILLKSDLEQHSVSELQSTINNIENGEYDDELNADQRKLALAILQNELEYRKETGEKQSYWVFRKNGEGGKQMVMARNENEAILQGGKNMGMSREQSITQLKAELKTEKLDLDSISPDEYANMLRNLPTYTLEKFVSEIKSKERSSLEHALTNVKARRLSSEVTPENYEFLEAVIERELRRRDEQGEPPEGYGQRKVYNSAARDAVNSMSDVFRNWALNIPTKDEPLLRDFRQKAMAGDYDNELDRTQKSLLIHMVDDELAYRASHEDGQAPSGTVLQFEGGQQSQAQAQPQDELPAMWEEWLGTIQAQTLATLSSVQSSLADDTVHRNLNASQRQWLRSRIEQEIQRRDAAQTQAETWPRPWDVWVRSLELHDMNNLRNVRASMTLPPNDPAARGITLSNDQRTQLVSLIDQEIVRRTEDNVQAGLAAQQAQLINRDDPVTSNDAEAESPLQGDQDFEIYNLETMQIISVVRQGTLDYAVQKARQHEQSLGLSAGDLSVRPAGRSTNESVDSSLINILKLAGL